MFIIVACVGCGEWPVGCCVPFSIIGNQYITTTAVVVAETMKMIVCLFIIWYQQPNMSTYIKFMYTSIIVNWQDTLKLSVPAIVYALQNNLQYVAVSNLEAAVFQVNTIVLEIFIHIAENVGGRKHW